jgi:hypothetical protein
VVLAALGQQKGMREDHRDRGKEAQRVEVVVPLHGPSRLVAVDLIDKPHREEALPAQPPER